MPIPLSRTRTSTLSPVRIAFSEMCPPAGVYLQAFCSRFETICVSRVGSPST